MARHAPQDEEVREHIDDVGRLELAFHPDGQALVRELVNDAEHAELPAIVGAILDEVVGHTWLRCSGRRRMHDPSASHSRPRFGCAAVPSAPHCARSLDPLLVH